MVWGSGETANVYLGCVLFVFEQPFSLPLSIRTIMQIQDVLENCFFSQSTTTHPPAYISLQIIFKDLDVVWVYTVQSDRCWRGRDGKTLKNSWKKHSYLTPLLSVYQRNNVRFLALKFISFLSTYVSITLFHNSFPRSAHQTRIKSHPLENIVVYMLFPS